MHGSDHPQGKGQAGAVNSLGLAARVAVVSDRSLIAEAVAAALAGSGVVVVRVPWPRVDGAPPAGWSRHSDPPSLGLIMCDLVPTTVCTAQVVLSAYPTRWLLLTDAPKGPMWGAMFELGVVGVLPSSTGLSDMLDAIAASRAGDPGLLPSDRDELVAAWRDEEFARMWSLTPRESEVLRQLHLGRSVHQIADLHGVAHSTVRSQVRSVLHKLEVTSQLAAAATLERWSASIRC